MRRYAILMCCGAVLLSCGMSDEVDCSSLTNPEKGIELVYPGGGESFELGSYVNVTWKADAGRVPAVVLSVSLSGSSGPWHNILPAEILVPGDTGVVCMDTGWVVGDEYDHVGYTANTTALFRVCCSTDGTLCDESGMISISRP